MKKQIFIIISMFGILGLIPGEAICEEVSLTSCDWEPYAAEKLRNYGFTSEIISKAFERVGYKVRFKFLPWKRAMMETKRGKYDALYSAYYSEERAKAYALSEPYTKSPVVFCARKDANITYTKLRDLTPYKIGIVQGYVNTPEIDKADYLYKDKGAVNDLQNLLKLLKGRTDIIIIDKYVAISIMKKNLTIKGDVKFLDPPLEVKPLFVMFSKAVPKYEKRLADFNQGLKTITDDSTLDNILKKHGLLIQTSRQ